MLPSDRTFSGALYVPGPRASASPLDTLRTATAAVAPAGVPGWYGLELTSAIPLAGELGLEEAGFRYHFLFRSSGDRFLLVGSEAKGKLVTHLLDVAGLLRASRSPDVDVDKLTTDLTNQPRKYCMTTLYCRVEGYRQALRRVAFFGSDLADAELFARVLPQLSPYRVALRAAASERDTMSVSAKGEVSFHFDGPRSLVAVDETLRFLTSSGYLEWGTD